LPRNIRDLSRVELMRALALIRDALYPPEEPDRQWSPDTLEAVNEVFDAFDLLPDLSAGVEEDDSSP
jgi:hypothetical protein